MSPRSGASVVIGSPSLASAWSEPGLVGGKTRHNEQDPLALVELEARKRGALETVLELEIVLEYVQHRVLVRREDAKDRPDLPAAVRRTCDANAIANAHSRAPFRRACDRG
jgi:hypothetical protein